MEFERDNFVDGIQMLWERPDLRAAAVHFMKQKMANDHISGGTDKTNSMYFLATPHKVSDIPIDFSENYLKSLFA